MPSAGTAAVVHRGTHRVLISVLRWEHHTDLPVSDPAPPRVPTRCRRLLGSGDDLLPDLPGPRLPLIRRAPL
jgi:hypothetical protein